MKKAITHLFGTALLLASFATAPAQTAPDDQPVTATAAPTPAQIADQAWTQLQEGLTAKNEDRRIATINALSLLGGNPRAEQMVLRAMLDANIDVRLAAVVAAGQMEKDRTTHGIFRPELHKLLSSNDPKLSFTAATTLWTLHDNSGEEVLTATAEGERASDYNFFKRSELNANRTLHNPEALAKIAITQGLDVLVPPVGMGMGAYGYLKGTPGASPQVTAIEQLAKVHTPSVQQALIVACKTKDPGARIAAAESLAKFPGQPVRDALYPLMTDDKPQVRLTASAAYIRNLTAGGTPAVASGKLSRKRTGRPMPKPALSGTQNPSTP